MERLMIFNSKSIYNKSEEQQSKCLINVSDVPPRLVVWVSFL